MSGSFRKVALSPEIAATTIAAAELGVWSFDVKTGIPAWDDGCARIVGFSGDAGGSDTPPWDETLEPAELRRIGEAVQACISGKRPEMHVEFASRRADGSVIWIESRGRVVERDERGAAVRLVGTVQDCTRRKKLEHQLAQAQRMDSIGALAGGVAHDFNNILLAISGQTELGLLGIDEGDLDDVRESLHEIREATRRATEMTRRLLTFGRRDDLRTRRIEVCDVVDDVAPMLRRLVPASIDLRTESSDDGSSVFVDIDRTSIEQVMLNLVVNARDAIGEAGTITIRSGTCRVGACDVEGYPWVRPGSFVHIDVEDDGTGIAAEDLARIFEPFYTTKAVGRGTGMGLSVVYGILRQHGGFVRAESRPGRGTTFRVVLPRAEAPATSRLSNESTLDGTEPSRSLGGGRRRVLLAEDNPMVRVAVVRMLKSALFDVEVAVDGAEAIDLIENADVDFDLAILDCVMPGRSGRDVFETLRSRRPSVPVIFASGYGADVMNGDQARDLGCMFLTKPFDRRQLISALEMAIDAAVEAKWGT